MPFGNIPVRINLASAVFASLAGLFFFLLIYHFTQSFIPSLISFSFLVFSYPFWSQAVEAEVYGLTALFITLVLYSLTRIQESRIRLFFAFISGLAFTNHMIFFSTFVGAGIFLLITLRKEISINYWLSTIGYFLLGVSLYLYLIIRAQGEVLFAWGNPDNLERLIWHITGKQYRVWMFSSSVSELTQNLKLAINLFLNESYYFFIPVAFWGFLKFRLGQKKWVISLLIIFILTIIYAINYSIPDISAYYLPALIVFFFFVGIGLKSLIEKISVRGLRFAVMALILLPLIFNYRRAGRQGYYLAYDQGLNHLKSAPENAIILTNFWDIYAPIFYLQKIEKIRTDVCIIDKELLRRSWYFLYLKKTYPWLIENSKTEVERYLKFLDEFEHNRLKDNLGIQNAFVEMINSFFIKNPERRGFLTFDKEGDYDARFIMPEKKRVPYGLLYELTSDTIVHPFDYFQFKIRKTNLILEERSKLVFRRYEAFARERAFFLRKLGRIDESQKVLDWVKNLYSLN